jgi:hypothetical protein
MRLFLFRSRPIFTVIFRVVVFTIISFAGNRLSAQPTIGLLRYEQTGQQEGYVLFAPVRSTITYLIDKCGRQVHSWNSAYKPSFDAYLLPDGSLLRAGNSGNTRFAVDGGAGGIIEKIAWDGSVEWTYRLSDTSICQHHDIKPMPNGNVLAVVWDAKRFAVAIDNGRNPAITDTIIWSEKIIEIAPDGNGSATIVWQWSLWDHLVQDFDATKLNFGVLKDHPELVNVNYTTSANPKKSADWIHANSVDYNQALDQIIISASMFNEIWIIDHSTTTEQAATHSGGKYGKGGDLLYRWGNPITYNRGTDADKILYGQHNAHWIADGLTDAGKIMIFNNGFRRPGNYSTVDVIIPPIDDNGHYTLESDKSYLPMQPFWRYADTSVETRLTAPTMSSAQRLPNGNTLICSGPVGTFIEITPDNRSIWRYKNPSTITGIAKQGSTPSTNDVFQAILYLKNFAGFNGRTLTPGAPIELEPGPPICTSDGVETEIYDSKTELYPNPAHEFLEVHFDTTIIPKEYMLINTLGEIIVRQTNTSPASTFYLDVRNIPAGMYLLKVNGITTSITKKVVVIK